MLSQVLFTNHFSSISLELFLSLYLRSISTKLRPTVFPFNSLTLLYSTFHALVDRSRYDVVYSNGIKSKPDKLSRPLLRLPLRRLPLESDNLSSHYDQSQSADPPKTDSLLDKILQDQREQRLYLRPLGLPVKRSSSLSSLQRDTYPIDVAYDWPKDKLGAAEKQLSSYYDFTDDKDNSDDNRQTEFEYESSGDSNNNPSANLFYLADQLAQDYQQQPIVHEGETKDIYQLEDELGDDNAESETSKESQADSVDAKEVHRNFTTLLEDTDETATTVSEASKRTSTTTTPSPPTTPLPPSDHHAKPSYGHLVTSEQDNNNNNTVSSTWTSKFARLYNKLADYMPSFGWSQPKSTQDESEPAFRVNKKGDKSSGSTTKRPLDDELPKPRPTTKPSVSAADIVKSSVDNQEDPQPSEMNDMKNDKQVGPGAKRLDEDRQQQDRLSEDFDNGFHLGLKTGGVKVSIYKDDPETSRVSGKIDNNESGQIVATHYVHRAKNHDDDDDAQKVSLLRESTVAMPYKADDEFLIKETSKTPESLLGRYIYAPEHHYHLSTVMSHEVPKKPVTTTTLVMGSSDDGQVPMAQRSAYMRHMRPEDDNGIFGGPFGGLRPMYGSTDTRLDGNGNKTNDFYFLVMVGAFCVMAMVVVLSAGLFAYRVQQNRKSTTESDYPTYGVVGPNNMNGKCGAAAFMGGYFGTPSDRAGTGTSSPIGACKSAKRLPDGSFSDGMVSAVSASRSGGKGHTNSTSDLASQGGKPSNFMVANQNAARMYHYQHQKQQMIISERASAGRHTSASDLDSEDEGDEGYTVYECPGLASAHEMEIKNPLFNDDQSP